MKKIVILGVTGTLGTQTLEILEKYPKHFEIIGLCANTNKELLQKQAKKFKIPQKNIVLASKDGKEKVNKLAQLQEADIIINVLSGLAGINPTIAALKAKKTVLLGNKESLVAKGKEIMKLTKNNLIPLDSEHNAIFEILKKFPNKKIKRIILPCSGGPFLNKTKKELEKVTPAQALNHPKWKMGKKVTIESATLINKGLEIIEAHYLFNLPLSKITVAIHPECQIHGIVEFTDKNVAYLAPPDMRKHIENALCHTANLPTPPREIRSLKPNEFTFQKPPKHLPGIKIILKAFKKSPSNMTAFLKKEESIINQFLQGQIKFAEIFGLLNPSQPQ
jgi:1-deoxy-D-xylulose-5-phosphate reductoisomerase